MTVKTEQLLQDGGVYRDTCTAIEQGGVVRFLWAKDMAAKDIHKKKCCPCTVNIARHIKKPSKTKSFGGGRFPDDAVETAVRASFRQQPREFYTAGFHGLVKRWDKCLNLCGDYVEK